MENSSLPHPFVYLFSLCTHLSAVMLYFTDMKKSDFKISLPSPCSASWQRMQPVEGGRYCLSCHKTVIDFTTMTDQEIHLYWQEPREKVCGRFVKTQLKEYTGKSIPAQVSPWQLYLLSLATIFSTKAFVAEAAKAQSPVEQREPEQQVSSRSLCASSVKQTLTLKGKVTSAVDDSPLWGVNVLLKGADRGVSTNKNGEYELKVAGWTSQPISLVYSYIGFQTIELLLPATQAEQALAVKMQADTRSLMGEVVIVQIKYPFPKNLLMFPVKVFNKAKCLIGR